MHDVQDKPTVLIVDDDAHNVEALVRLLERPMLAAQDPVSSQQGR